MKAGDAELSKSDMLISKMEMYCAQNSQPTFPIIICKGEGVWVEDLRGKRYLDMFSSYSTLNHGHRHPKIIRAMKEQLKRITLTSRVFYNDKLAPFSKHLCDMSGMEKMVPMTTGTEAVETAIKMMRKWGYQRKGVEENKAEIIVCENNYHGASTTIVGFSSDQEASEGYGPFIPGFIRIPFNNVEALKKAINPNTVAFLVEPIQGEGGIIVPDHAYLREVREICSKKRILLALDEVQTGMGRTGSLFAFQRKSITPDVLILGKALGGGIFPISAVLAHREVMDVFTPGTHGSTFGGNPLACAVADAALNVLVEERLAENAQKMGEYLMDRLHEIKTDRVKEIRGEGLLIGVEIYGNTRPLCEKLLQLGILAKDKHKCIIRLAPPLIIKKEQIDFAVDGIRKVLE